jgi:hypothetical protein
MMDHLISKMIYNNNNIENFDLTQNNHTKLPEKIYEDYIDKYTDWRNILDEIFYISTYKKNSQYIEDVDNWKNILLSEEILNFYNMVEKCIIKLINSLRSSNSKINIHTNISHNPIKGEIDILVDDTLIEMKTTAEDACTFPNLCQTLMYGYLLEKKNININKIIILNLWDGTMDTFELKEFNFKKFKKILYKV